MSTKPKDLIPDWKPFLNLEFKVLPEFFKSINETTPIKQNLKKCYYNIPMKFFITLNYCNCDSIYEVQTEQA